MKELCQVPDGSLCCTLVPLRQCLELVSSSQPLCVHLSSGTVFEYTAQHSTFSLEQ